MEFFFRNIHQLPLKYFKLVINKNFKVYGASSIGALRAVELEKFGMKGIGKIFELFKKNLINSDDEIAVTFDSEL